MKPVTTSWPVPRPSPPRRKKEKTATPEKAVIKKEKAGKEEKIRKKMSTRMVCQMSKF